MFTVEPKALNVPVTKAELDSQLKAQQKQLLAQMKKDVHSEIAQMVSKEGELVKRIEEAIAKSVDSELMKRVEDAIANLAPKNVSGANLQDGNGVPVVPTKHIRQHARPAQVGKVTNKVKAIMDSRSQRYACVPLDGEKKGSTTSTRKSIRAALQASTPRAVDVPGSASPLLEPEGQTDALMITSRTASREIHTNQLNAIQMLVLNPYFEYGTAIMVILNIILIGIETQIQSSYGGQHDFFTHVANFLDLSFCLIFTAELALRVYVYGKEIWLSTYLFRSTTFDAVLVAMQILDQAFRALSFNVHASSSLRIVRIVRIIRLVHLFDELSALISGMANSVESMIWAVLLLALVMYMFSIGIMQVLLATGDMHSHDELERWFGTVDRAICTMFEVILGGLNWSDVLRSLTVDVSPMLGLVLILYIITTFFFLMNLVCCVFVDRVTKTVREDKDETIAKRLSEIFTADGEEEKEVTWERFAEKMYNEADIQAYFSSIELDPGNPQGLFELLDNDGSGTLSGTEILDGCLRLRGPAKALDIAMLSSEVHLINRLTTAHGADLEAFRKEFKKISDVLDSLQKMQVGFASTIATMVAEHTEEEEDDA